MLRVWVTEISGLICYKILQFWEVIRGLFVGQCVYQVLRNCAQRNTIYCLVHVSVNLFAKIAVMSYVKEQMIERFMFRFHALRNIYTFIIYRPMNTDKTYFISAHCQVYYVSVKERQICLNFWGRNYFFNFSTTCIYKM